MSANQYICAVPIFQGNQGKYYIIDDYKYDIHFPLAWALDHHNEPYYNKDTNKTYINGSGPKKCNNCFVFGSLNSVFVGYCSNCLYYVYNDKRGDHSINNSKSIDTLYEYIIWKKFPYMNGVKISEIGDKNDDEETVIEDMFVEDECLSLVNEEEEDDEERMRIAHEEELQRMCEEDDRERYDEDLYEAQLEKFKDTCCRWD